MAQWTASARRRLARGVAPVVAMVLGLSWLAPLGVAQAGAATATTLYAYAAGTDLTGSTGCMALLDHCSLQGALDAAALSAGPVAIYLEDVGTSVTYQGDSGVLYHFDDPGIAVAVQPDPSLGTGAVSVFDARLSPGASILTLSGNGSVTLMNVEMDNADATTNGGALRISSYLAVTVDNATFIHDQTISHSNGGAIGLDNGLQANLTVNNSRFIDDWAVGVGGAIGEYQNSGSTTVSGSTFSGNYGGYGGAIGEGSGGSGSLSVNDSTFLDNSAIYGGAIENSADGGDSTALVQFSTFVDNSASNTGSAIASTLFTGSGQLGVVRSTVDAGTASTPAIAVGPGGATITGSIVSGTTTSLCSGTILDGGYNLETDASAGCGFTGPHDAPAGSDPGLATLASNGGPTMTEQVSAASAAAAAIASSPSIGGTFDSMPYVVCANPDTDQSSVAHSTALGCTMGALDATYLVAQSTPVVTAPADSAPATATFALFASGGAGTKAYVFSTATPGCTVRDATLSFTGPHVPTTCEVSAVSPANRAYAASASSSAQAFTFVAAPPVTPLVVTSTRGTFAHPLVVTSSGGSGDGATTYKVVDGSARGCVVSARAPYALTSATAGTCVLEATTTAGGVFASATSAPTLVTIAATRPVAPVIHLSSQRRGVAFIAVRCANLGGDPQTGVQYSLDAGPWRTTTTRPRGLIEVSGLHPRSRTTVRVRVVTAAGRGPGSLLLRFTSR